MACNERHLIKISNINYYINQNKKDLLVSICYIVFIVLRVAHKNATVMSTASSFRMLCE